MKQLLLCMVMSLLAVPLSKDALAQEGRGIITEIRIPDEHGRQVELYNESHALVIGVSDYQSGWPNLRGVKKDIRDVASILERQGFQVVIVENPDFDELRKAYEDFINRYGLDSENRLLLYFTGHGHTLKQAYGGEMGYIVPVDAANPNRDKAGFLSKAMDMQQIEVYARRIQSKHAIFLFDCCFSGSIFSLSKAVPMNISYKTGQPVRQFITAGSADEEVPDESIFCRQFVKALSGEGDVNEDGYVTGSELGEFLQERVINYSRETQHPQYGKIRDPNLDKGDFVFQLPQAAEPSRVDIPIKKPGESDFSLEDLEQEAQNIEENKAAWANQLSKMQQAMAQVESFEKQDVPADRKVEALQRILDSFGEDNPYSDEDDEIRRKARERIAYWRRWQNEEQRRREREVRQELAGQRLNASEWYNKAWELYDEGKYYEVIEALNRSIELKPDDAVAYRSRGYAYRKLGNYQQAIRDFDKAIELEPVDAAAYFGRGIAYGELGNYQQAIRDYDKAIELEPDDEGAYLNRGIVYGELGNYQQAIRDYDKAIELKPDDAAAYNNRGMAYKRLGNYQQAIRSLDKAIELEPDDEGAYLNRGIVYGGLGNYQQAIRSLDKAIELKPDDAAAYFIRGMAYGALGNRNQSIRDYQVAARLGDKDAQAWLKKQGESW